MDPQITNIAVIPLIVGLVQVSRNVSLPSSLAPLLAVVLGVLIAVGAALPVDVHGAVLAVLQGVAWGLAASGLYSGTQALAGGIVRKQTRAQEPGDVGSV